MSEANEKKKLTVDSEEKKKATVEDLLASQIKTHDSVEKISKQIARYELRTYGTNAKSYVVAGIGALIVLFAHANLQPPTYFRSFQTDNAIGATANALQFIEQSMPTFAWMIFGFLLICTSLLMKK